MSRKINDLALKAYINASAARDRVKEGVVGARKKISDEIREFNSDERGISGIIIAVLLILVAVVLVAVFWDYISTWFGNIWDIIVDTDPDISKAGAEGSTKFEGQT